VEELRMLSNFQTDDKSLLQTFLLGQPEFRATLHSASLAQLRQRVIATYHLGPMDEQETRAYIEHRLATVGWKGDPSFSAEAHQAIFTFAGGIPRKVNTLCDRLLLNGYLEEVHAFGEEHVAEVIRDIQQEYDAPGREGADGGPALAVAALEPHELAALNGDANPVLDERMVRLEKSIVSVLAILKRIVGTNPALNNHHE
jgi:hypothetical protein